MLCTPLALPAYAVDGIWTGGTSEWTAGTNWSSNPTVPDGTASFTNTGSATVTNAGGGVGVGGIQFTAAPNAQAYTFNLNNAFELTGAGIVNASTNTQTFNIGSSLTFRNNSTANGGVPDPFFINYVNNGTVQFLDSSRGGSASVVTGGGTVTFRDSSTAERLSINGTGAIEFHNGSTADRANIRVRSNLVSFFDNASAGNSSISTNNVNLPMGINFYNNSTAGNASIVVLAKLGDPFGVLNFYDSSTAGSASIYNGLGIGASGLTHFHNNSTAGNASIQNDNGGTTRFSDSSSAMNALLANGTNGTFIFEHNSTAANATIQNGNFGTIIFYGNSSAGTATITNAVNGNVFFSSLFGGNPDASNARILNFNGTVDISAMATGVSIGSLQGVGQVFLGSKNLTIGNLGDSYDTVNRFTDGGAAGGVGGSLTKVGNGVITLAQNNTYTGATNVEAGWLLVNGSLTSSVFVNGGTFGGRGTVAGLTANSGGTVAPGGGIDEIETLRVAGNATFNAGSFYAVQVDATGRTDKLLATGAVTLNGGTVQVLAQPGAYASSNIYTILTGTGGRTGGFSGVTSNFVFLTPSLSYDANNVFLTLAIATPEQFIAIGQTPNQRAVGGAIGAGPVGSALTQAILPLTEAQAQRAFEALSGEVHASIQTVLSSDAGFLRQAVLGRVRSAPYDGGATATLGLGGPMAYAAEPKARASFASVEPLAKPLTFWTQAFGSWGSFDGDGNAAKLTRNTGGAFSGLDIGVSPVTRLGFAAGYSQSSVNVSDRISSANIETAHIAAYAGTAFGAFKLRGGASYGWSTIDSKRTVAFTGFTEQESARYNAGTTQVFGEVGYGFSAAGIAVEPFAGLAWQNVHTRSFAETGGVAALNGSANDLNVGYSSLGLRAASALALPRGMVLIPRAAVAWQHAFSGQTPGTALSFASTGAGFNVAGVPQARDSVLIDAGLDFQITPRMALGLSFIGQYAASSRDAGIKGKFALALQ